MNDPGISREDYLNVLSTKGNDDLQSEWMSLWDVVADREGWHFEDDPSWCFGLLGACTVAITATPAGYVIYEAVRLT